jgi:putative ABC transport system permease protein
MPDPSTRWTQEVRTRLSSLRLSPTREGEIVEELSQHLDDRWRELIAGGASADEATRMTLAEFKGADVLANYLAPLRQAHAPSPITPGAPTEHMLAALLQSLRYAARILWKRPGFSVVAVLTLALGIGATTAVFSVVYGVLLKPLPFPEPDRLVALYHVTPASQRDIQGDATYFTYRENGRGFEDIGLWNVGDVSVTRNGAPEQVHALMVTDGTLSLLGVRAERGRLIRKEDDVPGAPLRVILTHAYWQQTFGASDVIAQSLVINATPYEVIGVLPASFRLLDTDPQLVLPLRLNRANARTGSLPFNGIARLKPGVTLSQANADIARMIPLLVQQFPLMRGLTQEMWDSIGLAPNLRPLSEAVIGEMGRPLWILLGTVGIVLLMAWTNVANLLVVRAEGRQRELAVRGALGASRGRIAAELLSESLMLGLAGGALGVLFAQAGIGLLRRMAPVALPRLDEIGIDGVVLLVTVTTSVITSLLFGVIPVLRSRVFNIEVLREAGRSTTDPPGRHRTRNTLVVAQVALALVLLIVSGLMARTFVAMRNVQPGFIRPAEVQTFGVELPAALIRDREQVLRAYEQIAERLRQVPGVEAVGLTGIINMNGAAGKAPLYVEGQPVPGLPPIRSIRMIGAGYFETMGNPVVAGRTITWTDIFESKPIVLISENLAREYWDVPAMAVGNRIGLFTGGPWAEIVGVVGNERADGLNHPAPPLVYFPMANRESASRDMTYVVRSHRAGAPGFLHELEQAVWSVNPNVPLAHVQTLEEIQAISMSQTSFAMVMLAIAASVALPLALVGVYGVVSYIAAERTYEVGIRMALGAQSGDVVALFLRHGLALTLAGLVLGIGTATLLTPILSALLYGVAPTDPVTYAGVAILLGAVTLLATYLPARRASRVEPTIALRSL